MALRSGRAKSAANSYWSRNALPSLWRVGAMLAIGGLCIVGYNPTSITQTSSAATAISKFADIAGRWAGNANNHKVTLEIDASGNFNARYPLGGESGGARLEGGALIIPLVEHNGALQLILDGDTLMGSGLLDGKTWTVSLRRSAPKMD